MKRPLTIAAITILAVVVLVACASTIRTGKTSIVTITIGGSSGTAVLKAEAATPWTRLKYYLADMKWVSEAYAYIPSVVQVLTVTVTAPDITTPIVGVSTVSSTQTTATLRIEVPNGTGRQFLVEGYRGLPGGTTQLFYSTTVGPVDLSGTDITLPVSMLLVGPGILVSSQSTSAIDTTGCGTPSQPCRSISFALSQTTGTDAVIVYPGTYAPVGAGGSENFPLPLRPGTALLCTGPSLSTVIDGSSQFGGTVIRGNENASIDNCLIKVGQGGTGVTDLSNPQLLITAATRINGSSFELPSGATAPTVGVALANDKSILIDSSITGTGGFVTSAIGVDVNSGKPSIIGSTISNLPTGIELRATAGDVSINNSFLLNNTTVGLETVSTGKPSISNTVFDGNSIGLLLGDGNPRITGSTFINNNNFGVEIISANPEISTSIITNNYIGILDSRTTYTSGFVSDNSIYCNDSFNLSTSITTTPNYQRNAWERSTPQVNGLAVGTNCTWGDDICANGPAVPDFSSLRTAVPGACNRPPQPAKPKM